MNSTNFTLGNIDFGFYHTCYDDNNVQHSVVTFDSANGGSYVVSDGGIPLRERLNKAERTELLGWIARYINSLYAEGFVSYEVNPSDGLIAVWVSAAKVDEYDMDFGDAIASIYESLLDTKLVYRDPFLEDYYDDDDDDSCDDDEYDMYEDEDDSYYDDEEYDTYDYDDDINDDE